MGKLINPEIEEENDGVKIDFSSFTSGNAITIKDPNVLPTTPSGKKRGRPRKETSTKTLPDGSTIITSDGSEVEPLAMWQSNQPYIETYGETTALLKKSIVDLEVLGRDVREALDDVKSSKTMRNKYTNIKDLADTSANIISSKIRAIQEINSVITKAHDLDMKRYKDNKAAQLSESANSDQRIFDMYNAFVNTPVGVYNPNQFPSIQEMTTAGSGQSGLITTDIIQNSIINNDPGYTAYKQRETPEQQMMILQKNNPNIKTVVVYNQSNQTKRFEVRDTITGEVVPGAPVPADFLLADTTINLNNGIARNANIDTVYPLVVEGMPDSILDY